MKTLTFHTHLPAIKPWLILALLTGVVMSCNDASHFHCIMKAGREATVSVYDDQSYHTISVRDGINLVIHPDTIDHLFLSGPENLLDRIDFSIKDSVCHVRNRNTCNWVRAFNQQITLHLHTRGLKTVFFGGTGNLHFTDTLYQASFQLEVWNGHGELMPLIHTNKATFKLHSGVAVITPHGVTSELDVYASGVGQINTLGLHADHVLAQHVGTNNAWVFASTVLRVRLLSVGNIYYAGSPELIILDRQGAGDVIRLPWPAL